MAEIQITRTAGDPSQIPNNETLEPIATTGPAALHSEALPPLDDEASKPERTGSSTAKRKRTEDRYTGGEMEHQKVILPIKNRGMRDNRKCTNECKAN
jgi:hypothetical protein